VARNLSVFDLDHTLFKVNSSYHFGWHLFRRRVISFYSLVYCLICYSRHKIFGLPLEELHNKVFRVFYGIRAAVLADNMKSFLDAKFDKLCYLPAVACLQKAIQEDHYVMILSNSPNFVVGPIAERFHVHEWLSTRYDTDDEGKLAMLVDLLGGEEKAAYVKKKAKELDIPLKNITAYSDSYLDLPLLQSVGVAIAVQPDKKLKEHSEGEQWMII
jgi:HAD superfamily hydrolase (TIGR01490 family)